MQPQLLWQASYHRKEEQSLDKADAIAEEEWRALESLMT